VTQSELLIRGAEIVDGTGMPGFTGDVEVRDGRIAKVGRLRGASAEKVIDGDGLVLTPGFVDVHTHYDAQLHFESSASPSSWHGVTTVLTGNCGFALSPSKPDDFPWLLLMLAKVEGMSADALNEGVDFAGGSVGDFIGNLDGRIGVNMAYYVGHCAVRRWVMGPEASERTATEDEITSMQALVDHGMRDGAAGFSTSQLDVHADHEGKPVPCNLAAAEEIIALASVLADYDEGIMEHLCRSFAEGYDGADRDMLRKMAVASGGKPLHVNPLLRFTNNPGAWRDCLDVLEGFARDGLRVYPMASANPKGLHVALADTGMLDEMPTFRFVLAGNLEQRKAALLRSDLRDAMRKEFDDPEHRRQLAFGWSGFRVVGVRDDSHLSWVGRTVAELAAERGADPLDTFIDLSLEEDLETVFIIDRPVTQEDHDVIAELLRHPLTTPGSSDGGAHVNTFCGADYTTRILTEYAGEEGFSFEQAIRKLTSVPAMTVGLWDRGVIRPGAAADLVLLDRDRLAVGPVRLDRDFPTGAAHLVFGQEGYKATIVNGQVVIDDGKPTGATAGTVLRYNRGGGPR
jgi:N-acyl-D-aspartate/D-glutamate deacylase